MKQQTVFTALVAVTFALGLLLGPAATQAQIVDRDGDTATGIRDLQVGGVTYDVVFTNLAPATIYGDPPNFDFNTVGEAEAAIEAATAALNAAGGIRFVGDSDETGLPIFRVGFDVSGDGLTRLTSVWESTPVDQNSDVWAKVTDPDVFPFLDDGNFADFTPSGGPPPSGVDLTGTVEDAGGTPLCSLALASGQFMFTCNPNGPYSLLDLPTESDGSVKRQVYVDGFFPNVETLQGSTDETVVMTRANNCPDYNSFPEPGVFPGSAGQQINVSGTILLQNTQTPVCAMALANGQFGFTCDGTGTYSATIPLDNNGQYKLQVYADGFAPMVQRFDEFTTNVQVRLARAAECQ